MLSQEIATKKSLIADTEFEISSTRKDYETVASHAALLFFCVTDMVTLDNMYQYSLHWYMKLYLQVQTCC